MPQLLGASKSCPNMLQLHHRINSGKASLKVTAQGLEEGLVDDQEQSRTQMRVRNCVYAIACTQLRRDSVMSDAAWCQQGSVVAAGADGLFG
jgi:hypothetical protein